MAVFSVNQARHLYVVANETEAVKEPHVIASDKAGTIAVCADKVKNHLYFEYKGAGGLMRSDLIDIKNIIYAKATDADNMAHKLKAVKVTLDSAISAQPVIGQDYILRIAFRQYIGMSDEDQYFKYGMVHTYASMNASEFYKKLAISLVKNFSRELTTLVTFHLTYDSSEEEVTNKTKESELTNTYTGLIIKEAPQEWTLGKKEQVPVYFEVQPTTITVNGDERIWGTVEDVTKEKSPGVIDNGHKIADLEYFCMGERGDIYRGMGYPNNIDTTYLVNPDLKYNTIDIHYAYVGSNESVQKSEKTLTLAIPKVGENNEASNKLTNDIIGKINTATGLSIATLDATGGD